MILAAESSILIVVDMQARLVPAIAGSESLGAAVVRLQQAAGALAVPTLATEQSPDGLGHTIPKVSDGLAADAVLEKTTFDATGAPEAAARLRALGEGRRQAVVCGAEAHVCVLQTALGLAGLGYDVFVVADAVGSRDPENRNQALARLRQAGVAVVTSEMVIFEWLQRSDRPEFREMLKLIK